MARIYDLDREDGPALIAGDSGDANPSLQLSHFGTGVGLNIVSTATTGIQVSSSVTTSPAASIGHGLLAGPTVAPLRLVHSTASGAMLSISGGLISNASLTVHSFAFPVWSEVAGKVGYVVARTIA